MTLFLVLIQKLALSLPWKISRDTPDAVRHCANVPASKHHPMGKRRHAIWGRRSAPIGVLFFFSSASLLSLEG